MAFYAKFSPPGGLCNHFQRKSPLIYLLSELTSFTLLWGQMDMVDESAEVLPERHCEEQLQ